MTETSRRSFLKQAGIAAAAATVWNAKSYAAIVGSNDRVRTAVIGAGDRMRSALIPSFLQHAKEMNFEFVAVSDIWNKRREDGAAFVSKKMGGGKLARMMGSMAGRFPGMPR